MKFKNKVDELYERLDREGKLTRLSDEQLANLDAHISKAMGDFRAELRRKQAQSEADTGKIVLGNVVTL
jgi:hypothetical protein